MMSHKGQEMPVEKFYSFSLNDAHEKIDYLQRRRNVTSIPYIGRDESGTVCWVVESVPVDEYKREHGYE